MSEVLTLNEPAPEFSLPADNGETVSLAQFRGKNPILVFFYPGDFTPVCTKEVCDFRDDYHLFQRRGVEILGISGDSVEKHRHFASVCKVPFRLLSDDRLEVARQWGARGLLGIVRRAYYLVDGEGVLIWQHAEVLPIFRLPNRTILEVIDRLIPSAASAETNTSRSSRRRYVTPPHP